jgi:hypothetical protein
MWCFASKQHSPEIDTEVVRDPYRARVVHIKAVGWALRLTLAAVVLERHGTCLPHKKGHVNVRTISHVRKVQQPNGKDSMTAINRLRHETRLTCALGNKYNLFTFSSRKAPVACHVINE